MSAIAGICFSDAKPVNPNDLSKMLRSLLRIQPANLPSPQTLELITGMNSWLLWIWFLALTVRSRTAS